MRGVARSLFMDGDEPESAELVEKLVGHWIDGGSGRGRLPQGPLRQ